MSWSSSLAPLLLALLSLWIGLVASKDTGGTVTYDSRSIIINGKRDLLFSGSIHYPRATPDMWPTLLDKAKAGGINVIQTYVFWNLHEPEEGKYNFEGNADLVKFIKLIQERGMYVTLRVGPFIQAEWNHGGFPYWIRDVKDMVFRTDNAPFKYHMKKFVKMIIDKMKDEKLFAPQGGPIILAQIENEYNNIQRAYEEDGANYVQWAGNMAVGLKTGVPWVMCKQKEAPDPVINTCNGRNCGDTFTGPNRPHKPSLWTENWTAQYRVFGDPPSQRSAEDLAYSVARFFSKNGTLTNYYMYFGGTNFGRTGASFVMTRYYDEAPLDEYGLEKDPKYGHLRDLHAALKLCQKALLWGTSSVQDLGDQIEARIYEKAGGNVCVAFLCNNHTREPAKTTFRGQEYYLPPHSISILPDCKTVVYNTQTVVSQHNARKFKISKANEGLKWEIYTEKPPTVDECSIKAKDTMELFSTTKDKSDYLWYATSIDLQADDLPRRADILPVIQIANLGHAMHVFINGNYLGFGHGNHVQKDFTLRQPVPLKVGKNHIQLLGMSVGFPDSGAYLEHRMAGVNGVSLQGLNTGTLDISRNLWGHMVGMEGEQDEIFTEKGIKEVDWSEAPKGKGPPISWYKTTFDAPEGENPIALNLTGMSKGMAWVNGNNIGRYWVSFLSPLGMPSQSEYHVPRSFIKPKDNLLVIFDEAGGNPYDVQILTVNRDTICSFITEYHPPNVKSWKRQESKILAVVDDMNVKANLKCPFDKIIRKVEFASYGNPTGGCGNFNLGNCTVAKTQKVVESHCLGRHECSIPIDPSAFYQPNEDPCPGMPKSLAIQVRCTHAKE